MFPPVCEFTLRYPMRFDSNPIIARDVGLDTCGEVVKVNDTCSNIYVHDARTSECYCLGVEMHTHTYLIASRKPPGQAEC